ncbi:MAG: flagellar basal-body MS-ring/collar protein FliF [Microbacteriaceae bacterium]
MPAPVSSALQRFVHAIREFTVAQRTLTLIGLAVLVVGAIALGAWLSRPSYAPLFSGLSGSDASAVVEQLNGAGVAYELADGGTTILVPRGDVDAQRMTAAANGLPSAESGGYALLDTMGVTASDFQQSVTYKRALEGELARTIRAMDGVGTASVQLAIPEKSVFVEEASDPTASVFLETRSGAGLGSEQVEAISYLVSASVPGLSSSDVSIVDAKGSVLSATGLGAGGLDQRATDQEARVHTAVQSMLDRIVGAGNATVAVSTQVEGESSQRVEETFTTPDEPTALNESSETESYTGTGGGNAGVLGPDNIAVPNGANGNGSYTSESTLRNNAVNKVTETRDIPAGSVARQSISVAVNSEAVGGITARTLQGLVAAAAGIDVARGDEVAVEMVAFSTAGAAEAQAALEAARQAEQQQQLMSMLSTVIPIALIALVIIVVVIVVARRRRRRDDGPIDIGPVSVLPQHGDEFSDLLKPAIPASGVDPLPVVGPGTAPTLPLRTIVEADVDRVRADIDAMAGDDPQRTAEYLRGLMSERAGV